MANQSWQIGGWSGLWTDSFGRIRSIWMRCSFHVRWTTPWCWHKRVGTMKSRRKMTLWPSKEEIWEGTSLSAWKGDFETAPIKIHEGAVPCVWSFHDGAKRMQDDRRVVVERWEKPWRIVTEYNMRTHTHIYIYIICIYIHCIYMYICIYIYVYILCIWVIMPNLYTQEVRKPQVHAKAVPKYSPLGIMNPNRCGLQWDEGSLLQPWCLAWSHR